MYEVYPTMTSSISALDMGGLFIASDREYSRFEVGSRYPVFKDGKPTGFYFRRWGNNLYTEVRE